MRVTRIGAEGDGIGALPDGAPVFLPGTLPGETVAARPVAKRGAGWAAEAETILSPSPARAEPPCPHFAECGGCTLQHWAPDAYATWKSGLLAEALRHAGFADAPVAPLVRTPPGARRRMDLALRREGGRITVGLHRRGRHDAVVDLAACEVLHPALAGLIAPLREMLAGLGGLKREGSAVANLLESGPDLLLRTDAPLSPQDRAALAEFARAHGLPRIAWALNAGPPEPAALLRPPLTALSGVTVEPPPGAFLQASAEGEAAIIAAVLAGLPKLAGKARIVELYAGCGTLSFALARHARVTAYEGDAGAASCLRRASGGLRVEAVLRDLARQPVMAQEMAGVAAVVLDPPHAGAAAQIAQVAASGVKAVIYVSCNPAALARDAATLRQAGYAVQAATPIDQFLWSARLESVVVFGKAPGRSG